MKLTVWQTALRFAAAFKKAVWPVRFVRPGWLFWCAAALLVVGVAIACAPEIAASAANWAATRDRTSLVVSAVAIGLAIAIFLMAQRQPRPARKAYVSDRVLTCDKPDPNQHIREYLNFYLSLPHSPHYAVMVNGPWGIGKTYLVKQLLNEWEAGNKDKTYVYVSLFGLSTIDEIDTELFRELYPVLKDKAPRLAGRVSKAALKLAHINLDELKLDELMDRYGCYVYVFDDLERCEMPINEVLGYINQFVEHEDCKVIAIANEYEFTNSDEYWKRREKLIGKTLAVQSAFDEAFASFASSIDDADTRTIFQEHAAEIASIYAQSELNNLRILQQTMWEFERLCCALSNKHRDNSKAMAVILGLVFALAFELKAGRINADDLKSRPSATVAFMAKQIKEPSGVALASQRYPEIDMYDTIISDDVLSDVLTKGIVNQEAIRSSLDKSQYFISVSDEPAWVTVWSYWERTDAELEAAQKKMLKQFEEREIVVPGELLHVLGLCLFLTRIDILGGTVQGVVTVGKQYIDDLYERNRLEPANEYNEVRFGGWGGLGICEQDTEEYRELLAYLTEKQQQVVVDTYPEKSRILLEEMENDADLFLRRVCFTQSEDNLFCRIPILAYIDPDVFVATLLAQHPRHQRTVLRALQRRYEGGSLDRDLAAERTWLTEVRGKLEAKAEVMTGIARYRLLNVIKLTIAPLLDQGAKTES